MAGSTRVPLPSCWWNGWFYRYIGTTLLVERLVLPPAWHHPSCKRSNSAEICGRECLGPSQTLWWKTGSAVHLGGRTAGFAQLGGRTAGSTITFMVERLVPPTYWFDSTWWGLVVLWVPRWWWKSGFHTATSSVVERRVLKELLWWNGWSHHPSRC